MKKPEHIRPEVWQQHLSWMKVMNEGQLTGLSVNDIPYKKKMTPSDNIKNNDKETLIAD